MELKSQAIPYDTQNPETEAPQGIIVHEKKRCEPRGEDPDTARLTAYGSLLDLEAQLDELSL